MKLDRNTDNASLICQIYSEAQQGNHPHTGLFPPLATQWLSGLLIEIKLSQVYFLSFAC